MHHSNVPQSVHLSIDEHLGCFYFLFILNNAAVDICVHFFLWTYVFGSLGYIYQSGIIGSYSNCMFNILRTCQSVSQNDCTILQSHQPCLMVPISPYDCQYFLMSVLLILAILEVPRCGFDFHLSNG